MTTRTVLVICLVLLASLLVLGTTANVQNRRPTWEYKVLYTFDEKQMNGVGAEGWELVAIAYESGAGSWAFFKRPK